MCTQRVCAIVTVVLLAASLGAGALLGTPPSVAAQGGFALRFYGNGANDIDRVKVALGPSRPVNVGATDFTIEFYLRALPGENTSGECVAGEDTWINGNILLDRDIFGDGDYGDYGVSLYGGRIAFGVHNGTSGVSICGGANVANGDWHHVALTRRAADGRLSLYVDGHLDAQADGPDGDISYREGRTTQYPNDAYLVIGAEKHDYDRAAYPSFSGWLDELRFSTTLRYTAPFSPPSQPFAGDSATAALYHFDEGAGDTVADSSGPSDGVRRFGGSPAGPEWST
ncbi:MAG TPA: LamG-like jellyroll fold domain-containing protein, partial [Roseiflexaceae bacterium]|nr:LamG-like jellyroll fold domain-containing protein [Roseiflexaceae bacterium]